VIVFGNFVNNIFESICRRTEFCFGWRKMRFRLSFAICCEIFCFELRASEVILGVRGEVLSKFFLSLFKHMDKQKIRKNKCKTKVIGREISIFWKKVFVFKNNCLNRC